MNAFDRRDFLKASASAMLSPGITMQGATSTAKERAVRYHQAILVSCEIPWDDNQKLLENVFRAEIRSTLARGFKDVYIFGTAGEGYAVDTSRFQQIVQIFYEETRKEGVTAQVGVIDLSTARIVERLRFAHELGFRAFQISLPCWGVLNDAELMTFFKDVCGTFPDSKFLHYNLPRAGRVLTAADYRRLADEVSNLAATKITGTTVSEATELMTTVPELQHFFGESLFPIGCLYGECSLLSSFAPMMPSRTKEFFEYGRRRQFDKLFALLGRYLAVMDDVLSPTRGKNLIDGAYDKMIVRLGGLEFPPRLLSPYEWFPETTYQACRKILHEKYADWMG